MAEEKPAEARGEHALPACEPVPCKSSPASASSDESLEAGEPQRRRQHGQGGADRGHAQGASDRRRVRAPSRSQ